MKSLLRPPDGRTRKVLAVALVALLVASAGCSSLSLGDGGGNAPSATADDAPNDSEFVVWMDMQGAMNDGTLRELSNEYLSLQAEQQYYEGPTNVDEAISQMQNQSGLDPTKAKHAMFFGSTSMTTSDYFGMVLTGSWSTDEFVTTMKNESSYEYSEETYNGHTVHVPDSEYASSTIGVLKDGKFVVGSEAAVKDAIDVAEGDVESIDGPVRDKFETTREGHLRYAMSVPQERIPAGQIGDDSQFNTDVFNKVTVVSGSGYTTSDSVGLTVRMTFSAESAAGNAKSIIKGATQMYRGVVSDNATKTLLSEEHLTVEQSGSDVTVTSENSVDTLSDLLERLYGGSFGGV